jgi:hypothetical protein
MADLKDIELARVGEFELSTGKQKFTPEMLADAARRATEQGPQFRAPLKLGHTDPRNDGEPAMGWLHNVRVEADGVLRGDATGVPQWLADNAKTAYPDRSIEANRVKTADGTDGMELTGLALLGQTPPGIATLASWRELPALIAAAADMPVTPIAVAYAAIRDTPEAPAEPPVIVPIPTQKEADTMSETLIKGLRERFGFADDATEETILKAVDEARDPAVTPEAIAASFKLTPEQVTTALAAAAKPPVVKLPDGVVAISQDVLDDLKIAASAGAEARKVQLEKERDETIGGYIAAALLTPARREFWNKKWDLDPEGTQAELKTLGDPVLPIAASGYGGNGDQGGADSVSEADIAQLAKLTGLSVEELSV